MGSILSRSKHRPQSIDQKIRFSNSGLPNFNNSDIQSLGLTLKFSDCGRRNSSDDIN